MPGAEVHILDAGHFALDEQAPEVIRQTQVFMDGDNKENVMKVEFSLRDVSRTMNNGNRDYRKAVK